MCGSRRADAHIRLALSHCQITVRHIGHQLELLAVAVYIFIIQCLLYGAALGGDHGVLQRIQIGVFPDILCADNESVARIGGVIHITQPQALRAGGGIGDSGEGKIIFAVRNAGEYSGEIQRCDLQLHTELIRDVLGHLNVHALILVLPALVGVYIFIGGEIGLGTQLDIAFFLDLRQTVLGLPILAAAAGGAGQCQNSRQQNCHCLFHILALVSVGFGTLVPPL